MVVLRSATERWKRLRSADVSDWHVPKNLNAKPTKERKYKVRDLVRPYAANAMGFYNKEAGKKYVLVEPGCLTSVPIGSDLLHHVDFTAKKADVADAPKVMFFAELTTTSGVCSVKVCKCMGPRDLISGDKNNGCCHCTMYNVQHPQGGGFSRGGHGLFRDDSGSSSSSNPKSLPFMDVSDSDWPDPYARTYAADAINFYNKRSGEKYELVDPGSSISAILKTCILHHIGFTAKKTDVADAPEEMFFAELTTVCGVRDVKFLRCMGRKAISGGKNNGCCYCPPGKIHHPRYGGFARGAQGLFLDS